MKEFKPEITSETPVKAFSSIVRSTADANGYRGGSWSYARTKDGGWLLAVVFAVPGGHDHWNYHPGRKVLSKTHRTSGPINVANALDDTIKALTRLYPED